mgnify:FL=1
MASWFNPTDFATGVLESLDKRIDRNAEEARVYKEEQRDLAKQSKQAIANRTTLVQNLLSVANNLKLQGVSQAQIKAAHSAGPDSLLNLSTEVQAYLKKKGTKKLSPDEVEAMITTSDLTQMSPEVQSMNLRQFLDATSNMPTVNTVTETADDRNILERALGVGQKDAIRVKLDQEMQPGGFSVADLNEAATLSSYNSLMPGASATFTAPVDYKSSNAVSRYDTFYRSNLNANALINDSTYQDLIAAGKTEAELRDYRQGKIEGFVRGQFGDFGFQALTDPAMNYRDKLGDERFIGLINDLDLSDAEMQILNPMFNGDEDTSKIKLMLETGSSEIVRDRTGNIISVTNFNLEGNQTSQYSGENASDFINGMIQSNLLKRDPETGVLTVSGTSTLDAESIRLAKIAAEEERIKRLNNNEYLDVNEAMANRQSGNFEKGDTVTIGGKTHTVDATDDGRMFFTLNEEQDQDEDKEFAISKTITKFVTDWWNSEPEETFLIKSEGLDNSWLKVNKEELEYLRSTNSELVNSDNASIIKTDSEEGQKVNRYDIKTVSMNSLKKLLKRKGLNTGEE